MGVTRHKAGRWRSRYVLAGRAGIEADAPGRGRKPTDLPEVRQLVVAKTTRETPPNATHWSLATMAKALDLSPRTVGRIWQEHGLKPHLVRTFKVSNDPRFAEKLEDVIGRLLRACHALWKRERSSRVAKASQLRPARVGARRS